MTINTPFIKKYIKKHGLSINAFSKRAHMTCATMWRILHGQKSLKTDNLIKIIKAMHLKQQDLSKIFLYSNLYGNVNKKESSEK